MSFLSKIKEFFSPKVIFVSHSELSRPTECQRYRSDELDHNEIVVMQIIGNQNGMRASAIDRQYNSGGRRANDLLHKGYCENIGNKRLMKYVLSEKGFNFLNKL